MSTFLIRDDFDLGVWRERARQDEKFGEQNLPNGTGSAGWGIQSDLAKHNCDRAMKQGLHTWRHVLTEEVYEAFAETDETKLKAELIQVAAVCKAWIQCIERAESKRRRESVR